MNDLVVSKVELLPDLNINIPEDVFELLWIKNGDLQNFNMTEEKQRCRESLINIFGKSKFPKDPFSKYCYEPSLIDIELPISVCANSSEDFKMYDPTYENLTPENRYLYLKWLSNIDVKSSETYAFLYFYGLERHLFLGKYEKAFDMVLRLLNVYGDSKSFQSHATRALVIAAYTHKDINRLGLILFWDRHYTPTLLDYVLGTKYLLSPQVTVRDIRLLAGLSKKVLPGKGVTIVKKLGGSMESKLENYFLREYGVPYLPLSEDLLKAGNLNRHNRTCNTSIHYLFPYDYRIKQYANIVNTYGVIDNKLLMETITDALEKAEKTEI